MLFGDIHGFSKLSDAQLRALSGHKTASMVELYAKTTMKQRKVGARKRLESRTKAGGNVGMSR